jgi:hypothetical protein
VSPICRDLIKPLCIASDAYDASLRLKKLSINKKTQSMDRVFYWNKMIKILLSLFILRFLNFKADSLCQVF